jgi:hypothetical protein
MWNKHLINSAQEREMTRDLTTPEGYEEVIQRLERIEAAVITLVERQTLKEWYSTEEVAKMLGKAEFTVREWCRLGRIRASKKAS